MYVQKNNPLKLSKFKTCLVHYNCMYTTSPLIDKGFHKTKMSVSYIFRVLSVWRSYLRLLHCLFWYLCFLNFSLNFNYLFSRLYNVSISLHLYQIQRVFNCQLFLLPSIPLSVIFGHMSILIHFLFYLISIKVCKGGAICSYPVPISYMYLYMDFYSLPLLPW